MSRSISIVLLVLAVACLPLRLVAEEKPEKPRALKDILQVDAKIAGDWREVTKGGTGNWSLKITKRNGNKFEGKFEVEIDKDAAGGGVFDVEGIIGGNNIEFDIVKTAKVAAKVKGRLAKAELNLDYESKAGTRSKMKAINVK